MCPVIPQLINLAFIMVYNQEALLGLTKIYILRAIFKSQVQSITPPRKYSHITISPGSIFTTLRSGCIKVKSEQ